MFYQLFRSPMSVEILFGSKLGIMNVAAGLPWSVTVCC